jgi:hypothetical protein
MGLNSKIWDWLSLTNSTALAFTNACNSLTKEEGTDVLVMTATPIPRTLALTAYGDMEVSRILGKPPGRKPIDTRLISQEKFDEMVERLKPQIAAVSKFTGFVLWWRNPNYLIWLRPVNALIFCNNISVIKLV